MLKIFEIFKKKTLEPIEQYKKEVKKMDAKNNLVVIDAKETRKLKPVVVYSKKQKQLLSKIEYRDQLIKELRKKLKHFNRILPKHTEVKATNKLQASKIRLLENKVEYLEHKIYNMTGNKPTYSYMMKELRKIRAKKRK